MAALSFSAAIAPAKLRAPVARRSVRPVAAARAEYKSDKSQYFDLKARGVQTSKPSAKRRRLALPGPARGLRCTPAGSLRGCGAGDGENGADPRSAAAASGPTLSSPILPRVPGWR